MSRYKCPKCTHVNDTGKHQISDNGQVVECPTCKQRSRPEDWAYVPQNDDPRFEDMTPYGMQTLAGAVRCDKAIKAQDKAKDSCLFNHQQFVREVPIDVIKRALADEYGDDLDDVVDGLYKSIEAHSDTVEESLRAIAGHPPLEVRNG